MNHSFYSSLKFGTWRSLKTQCNQKIEDEILGRRSSFNSWISLKSHLYFKAFADFDVYYIILPKSLLNSKFQSELVWPGWLSYVTCTSHLLTTFNCSVNFYIYFLKHNNGRSSSCTNLELPTMYTTALNHENVNNA